MQQGHEEHNVENKKLTKQDTKGQVGQMHRADIQI